MVANLAPLGGNAASLHSSSRSNRTTVEQVRGKILGMLATKSNAVWDRTKNFVSDSRG